MEQRSRGGRPRSEDAHAAVLHAVDDLLVEGGYAAMTMRGIAERAGVGRQTLYRWWSTKAEILLEACIDDARSELEIVPQESSLADLTTYLERVEDFLTRSPAGAGYRALMGEAQHDPAVAQLIELHDVLADSARRVLKCCIQRGDVPGLHQDADPIPRLVGPLLYCILSGRPPVLAPAAARDFVAGCG